MTPILLWIGILGGQELAVHLREFDRRDDGAALQELEESPVVLVARQEKLFLRDEQLLDCLLYTSDAADE